MPSTYLRRRTRSKRDFTGLHLVAVSHRPPTNNQQLWEWLQARRDSRNQHPLVGIFDSDAAEYVARIGPDGWKHIGNGVVAIVLAPPGWLLANAMLCIELLHQQVTLRRADSEGRRVFLREEFDEAGLSYDTLFRMRYPRKTTLVVEDVVRVADEKSVGLAKMAFADRIYGRVSPYEAVDFEGFRPTLERLWTAVAAAQAGCS